MRRLFLRLALAVLWCCGCTQEADCPDSLPTSSAEWSSAERQGQCAELAELLNGGGGLDFLAAGDAGAGVDDPECIGHMQQTKAGDVCRASIGAVCQDGLSFEFSCVVKTSGADCDATVNASGLDHACKLRVRLR